MLIQQILFTVQHRAEVRPYTSSLPDFAESCVFSKQSLPSFQCHSKEIFINLSILLQIFIKTIFYKKLYIYKVTRLKDISLKHSPSRSYRANLPSSLNIILPLALVYSTQLPVSVCSTVDYCYY